MGCDGGTIPRRDELVRMKKEPEKVDKNFELNAKWFHCAVSQEHLRTPIVSCELGNLYNKETLLEYLLDKSSATTDIAKHIRSLRDTRELNLTANPAFDFEEKSKEQAVGYVDIQASRFICPVVGIEMNGRYKFCFLWKCGCVFSERALKEVKSSVCHKCDKPFSDEDIILLNGTEEEVEVMKSKMEERRIKAKLEKKAKKSKVTETITSGTASANGDAIPECVKVNKRSQNEFKKPAKKLKLDIKSHVNGAASSSSAIAPTKKGKEAMINMQLPELPKHKTVAEDPGASKVFKSLFTSGSKKRPKHLQSNWVTHHSYGGYHI